MSIEEKVIKFEDNRLDSKVNIHRLHKIKNKLDNRDNFDEAENEERAPIKKPCLSRKQRIALIVVSSIVAVVVIAILLYVFLKEEKTEEPETQENPKKIQNIKESQKIETEFVLSNKVREPYRINVEQKYNEEILTNGIKSFQFVDRKTNYDIFIINETNSTEETKNFYDKIYTAAILISSQCMNTTNENCEPQTMIDLTPATKNNLRSLEEIPDFKDVPVPLCLFNITDNDVITSMLCPGALHQNIRQAMILDLYFFRPPAIKRPDKEGNNVTLNKTTKNGKQYIRETNGGICDVPDSFESFCTTEMNTTTDLNGNILTYDEIAFTNILHDENNSYKKNKITNLKDETEKLANIDKESYKEALLILIEKLKPYFKYYEEFTLEQFNELYNVSKNISGENEPKNSRRNLYHVSDESSANEEKLFSYRHYTDINFYLKLLNDPGYNKNSIRAALNLETNEIPRELISYKNNSNFNDIIKLLRDLSNSGNYLATELYNKIKNNLEELDDIIYENITTLINLIVNEEKKSLLYIFDAASNMNEIYFLPIKLVQETSNLKNNLNNLLTVLKNGGKKSKFSLLNTNIYSFLSVSHNLLENVFQKVRSLSQSLRSSKSQLTEIATYYLNNTPDSFSEVVEKAKDLLFNYYKKEDDMIKNNVTYLLGNFTEKLYKSIELGTTVIDNLLNNLQNNYLNITIVNGNEEDKNLLITNLRESKEIIESIISKVEELIKKEMNLKANGHFLSSEEIISTNQSYYPDIEDGIETSKILDNDEKIDKVFDKTFSDFKDNYTKLIISEKRKILENAVFSKDVLNNGLFSDINKTYLETNISTMSLKITDIIKNDNDLLLNEANKEIDDFMIKYNQTLKDLIKTLKADFSEDIIIDLAGQYDKALESSLKALEENIEKNKELTYNYFSNVSKLFKDSSKIVDLLKSYQISEEYIPYYLYYWSETHYVNFTNFKDTIKKKLKTNAYLNKYKIFNENMESSKDYINEQLQSELKYEYKNIITKLKELLQMMKNAKLSDRFPNYPKLNVIDSYLKDLDNIYKILNTYFYNEKYNNDYLPKINSFKKNSIKKIDSIENDIIELNHKEINKYPTTNDNSKDFCFNFYRKITYTCTNGVIYYRSSTSNYCEAFPDSKNNYNKLKTLSIYSCEKFQKYSNQLKNIYTKISNIVSTYTDLINDLSQKLYALEKKENSRTLLTEYFQDYKKLINKTLANYYGNNIILETYNYFRKDTETRINDIFDETSNNWEQLFLNLNQEVNNNLGNYKNSITEFGLLSIIYFNYYYINISQTYYDLISTHAKNEFNYTISYYYNYLLRLIKSEEQKIISKIPTNNIGFIRVIEQIKKEINQMFEEMISVIVDSKNKDLSRYKQIYLLQVPDTNFFNISYTYTNFRKVIKTKLEKIPNQIYTIKNEKKNDLYSYISRLYLENSLNGKQINDFYKEVDDENFIYLKLDKFEELIINNWIFDQDNFIKVLKDTFVENNAQISNELSLKKDKYKTTLENELIKYETFKEKNITFIIDNLYLKAIKEVSQNDIKQIEEDFKSIVNKIIFYLNEEKEWLNESNTLYHKNFSLINKTIKEYKENIISNMENKIKEFVDVHKKELEEKVFSNYYEYYLNKYLYHISEETKTESYMDINLLNSTYNIGKIINQISQDLKDYYLTVVKSQINNKYEKYYNKITSDLNFIKLKEYIINQIDENYSDFFKVLQTKAIKSIEDITSFPYDLREDTKKGIDDHIKTKYNTFNLIIESLKDETYNNIDIRNHEEWKIPDFGLISNVIIPIKNSFEQFIESQKINEENKIREFIEKTMKYNFYDLLNNLIPSFGNEFFERIIAFNENFKIVYLYDNLKWALSESISYIEILDVMNNINQITKDLKIKIYRMNDLDLKISQYNKKILDSLNEKANDFIFNSRVFIIQKYKEFIHKDANLELSFSPEVVNLINSEIEKKEWIIGEDYKTMMEKYLKENLISSYKIILDKKTNDILRIINSHRDYLKIILDDIYSIDPDDILNEIKEKSNSTSLALKEYNDHFYTFKISPELIEFLYNYGNNEVRPLFESLQIINNELFKDSILLNLEKNSKDYENSYNYEIFNKKVNASYETIKSDYIVNLNESGHYYYDNYSEKLDIKINDISLRRLDENNERKIPDRYLSETFDKILNDSLRLKVFVQSLEKFDEFNLKIDNSVTELNTAYIESKKLIEQNNYTDEIKLNLNDKLDFLKNHSLEYYFKINETFYYLKNYLNESISFIDDLFNDCANITIETFEKKYEDIFDKVNSIHTSAKEEIEIFEKSGVIPTQNNGITVNTSIEHIKGDILFNYNYQIDKNEKGRIKLPKLSTSIINLSRPQKMLIKIIKEISNCAKEIEEVEVIFNNANYSTSLDFSPDSRNIISNISGLFDDYEYTVERYNTSDTEDLICTGNGHNSLRICFLTICSNTRDQIIIPKYSVSVTKRQFSNIENIPE